MKKDGLTLIELLAVIALIAILFMVIFPNVVTIYKNAIKNSFTTELRELHSKAKQEWIGEAFEEPREEIFARCRECSAKELPLNGRTSLSYYIKVNKAGEVVEFCATDGVHQYSFNSMGVLKAEDIIVDDVEVVDGLVGANVLTVTDSGC